MCGWATCSWPFKLLASVAIFLTLGGGAYAALRPAGATTAAGVVQPTSFGSVDFAPTPKGVQKTVLTDGPVTSSAKCTDHGADLYEVDVMIATTQKAIMLFSGGSAPLPAKTIEPIYSWDTTVPSGRSYPYAVVTAQGTQIAGTLGFTAHSGESGGCTTVVTAVNRAS